MRIIKKTYNVSQQNLIDSLAKNAGILRSTAEILYGRGYDTAEKALEFMSPEKWEKYSPFTLSGMSEAVERIKEAKENGETVVVYGDYDVDGICATTVLVNSLKKFGISAHAVIPERENGYGLSEGVLNEVLDNLFPDLIITVDCGISAVKEVEYLKDLGVDIIITDHHEFPEITPDAIIVSTKTKGQEYPFEYLSGAGVSYKLSCALIGDEADAYLDLVALATVADSMPLIGENRNIVYHGVELIKNGRCSKALTSLLYASGARDISATSLSFTVAPRINAAGRMGDAYSALKLFLTDSHKEREELTEKLNRYNQARQQECEILYSDAKNKLKTGGNYGKVIVLYDKEWKGGLLGIVSARLTEEYGLPSILFSELDGALHGSARSNGEVSVYDAIASASDILIEYGGHSQAAGVTVLEENFEEFANRVNAYISENYGETAFEKTIEPDYVLTEPFSLRFAKEIAKFEPFGLGNKKPIILAEEQNVSARPLKIGSTHLAIKTPNVELVHFNGVKFLPPLETSVKKSILFESSVSSYNGKEQPKGIVKTISFTFSSNDDLAILSLKNALLSLCYKGANNFACAPVTSVKTLVNACNPSGHGTLLVLTNPDNFYEYDNLSSFSLCPLNLTVTGGKNALLIGGDLSTIDLSSYDEIIYLDKPLSVVNGVKSTVCELPSFDFSLVSTDRNVMGAEFRRIKELIKYGKNRVDIIKESENPYQTAFSLEVFIELGFIHEDRALFIVDGVRNDLSNSKIYSAFSEN